MKLFNYLVTLTITLTFFDGKVKCNNIMQINSGILTDEEKHALTSMDNFNSFELLYRGTRDGFRAVDFHKKCDGISGTLTIIKSNSDSVFGGYTRATWNSEEGEYKKDSKAFLYSLRRQGVFNNERFNIKLLNYENAIYAHPKLGPVFGIGSDIYISDMANENYYSFTGFCNTYKCPQNWSDDSESDTYLAGSEFFYVEEVEVFQVTTQSFKNSLIDSIILNENETNSLFNLTGHSDWALIYRASRDGFDSSYFHSKCDGYTPTLTLIYSEYESVFGGFTTASWDCFSKTKIDLNSYLFSLRRLGVSNKERFRSTSITNAIFTNSESGPSFGYDSNDQYYAKDIRILNRSNEYGFGYSYFCSSYKCPKGLNQSSDYLAGSYSFYVNEIEVFTFTDRLKSFIDSVILTITESYFLRDFSGFNSFTLLYRASRDGFTAGAFHSKCDNIEGTIVLIKNSYNYVFGGYTSASWDGCGYKKDNDSYIFSLRRDGNYNKAFYRVKDSEKAIYADKSYGPKFGEVDIDLQYLTKVYCYSKCSECSPSYSTETISSSYTWESDRSKFLAGKSESMVREIEVYQVKF